MEPNPPKIKSMIKKFLLAYLFCTLLCVIITPLVQTKDASTPVTPECVDMDIERVLCIEDNAEALLWRLRLIESAENEIILSTFNFGSDESGNDMMATLLQAADRGVHIRMLIDGLYGATELYNSDTFDVLLAHENIEVKLYNTINLLKPWNANYRMHDKYLIADERAYILGGRNTADISIGEYNENANVDRDVLVYEETFGEDASIFQLKQYFEEVWALSCNKTLTGHAKDSAEEELAARYTQLRADLPQAFEETDWLAATIPANFVTLISNPVSNQNKEPILWRNLCALMQDGNDVIIQTPYAICSSEMYQDLSELTASGIRLRLLTNSPANSGNPWGASDYLNQKNKLLKTGTELCEYNGGRSMHTKTVLIDDNISIIGSFNMDMRSAYLDTETMLVIDCPELNTQLREELSLQLAQSKHILPDGSETYGHLYVNKDLGFFKTVLYTALRILILPIRHLL